jgi:Arylsulfotransferase (ASST)
MTLLAVAAAGLGDASAAASVRLSGHPSLSPRFQRGVPDYVSRCVPGEALRVHVKATGGDTVAVAGRAPRSGEFVADVRRKPGLAFPVRVRTGTGSSTHRVRCLPPDFPRWAVKRKRRPQAQWYALTPIGFHDYGYAAIFDSHGTPIWWRHSAGYGPYDLKLLPDGDLAWTRFFGLRFGQAPEGAYEEHRLEGRPVRTIRAVGNPTDTHDMQQMPNGHYLVLAYRPREGVDLRAHGGPRNATVLDGEVQELTPSGKLVWSWNSKDHIALSETQDRWWSKINTSQKTLPPAERRYDLVHINSVEPDGDGFVISLRCLDAVVRVDRKSGGVRWKLGGSRRPQSLAVKHDPRGRMPLGGQHDARLYRDGSLTVFDNRSYLHQPPRAVRYRIDTQRRTATLLEEIREPDVPNSDFAGSARKLAGGDWVVSWGGTTLVTEQTPTGEPALAIRFRDGMYSYRAAPVPHGVLSAGKLRAAMSRMSRAGKPRTTGRDSRFR